MGGRAGRIQGDLSSVHVGLCRTQADHANWYGGGHGAIHQDLHPREARGEPCGKDATGRFRTRVAQAYSSEFCRMLAECHVDAMLNMQERREAELTERAVEQLIAETLERRRRDHSSVDILPTAFLEASG